MERRAISWSVPQQMSGSASGGAVHTMPHCDESAASPYHVVINTLTVEECVLVTKVYNKNKSHFVPTFLPPHLPASLPFYLPMFLLILLPTSQPTCLSTFLPIFLLTCTTSQFTRPLPVPHIPWSLTVLRGYLLRKIMLLFNNTN